MAKEPTAVGKPDFRNFRRGAYAVYLVVVVTVSLLVFRSIVLSVISMSPRRPHHTGVTLKMDECGRRLQALWEELEHQRQALGEAASTAHADVQWTSFRVQWLGRLRQDEAQCGVDQPSRQGLQRAFRELGHVADLYTTSSVQFEGEIGPSVDSLKKLLAELDCP